MRAVITAADIGDVPKIPLRQEPLPQLKRYEQPVIAHDKVRYVGEPIAVVVADSAAIAEDALEAIVVDIEPLPAVPDRDAARKDDVLLFEEIGTNIANTMTAVRGDADAAFKNAPYTRREHFSVQRHAAVPMEPRGLLAEWDADEQQMIVSRRGQGAVPQSAHAGEDDGPAGDCPCACWSTTSAAASARAANSIPEDFLIPFAARLIGRPVKWIEDRRENLLATNHARDAECELEIACTRDGTILALARPRLRPISAPICAPSAPPPRAISSR